MKNGILIDIEGIDGCGKHTQTKMLQRYLSDRYGGEFPIESVSFPRYNTLTGMICKNYLNGNYGPIDSIGVYEQAIMFAMDRKRSFDMEKWGKVYRSGGIVIADRYTGSSLMYSAAKALKKNAPSVEDVIQYVQDLEYSKLELPIPTITFYLSVPVEEAIRRMMARYHGDSEKMDLHEKDTDYLNSCIKIGDLLSDMGTFAEIDCRRSPDDIASILQSSCDTFIEHMKPYQ